MKRFIPLLLLGVLLGCGSEPELIPVTNDDQHEELQRQLDRLEQQLDRLEQASERLEQAGGRVEQARVEPPSRPATEEPAVSTTDATGQTPSAGAAEAVRSRVIPGTYSWDIESDSLEPGNNVDLWWEHETETERQLTAQNGAALARIADRKFDEIDREYLESIQFHEQSIPGSDKNNLLTAGTVFGLRTMEGDLAKLRVKRYLSGGGGVANYDIELEWVLYELKNPGTSPPAADTAEQTTVSLEPRQGIFPGLVNYYRPIRIQLEDTPQEELTAEPAYESDAPQYGVLTVGDAPDNRITVVVDEVDPETSRIYIDRNNDQDLTNDGSGEWTGSSASSFSLKQVLIDVPYQEGSVPATFEFYRFKSRLRDCVLYYRSSAREGVATIGDADYKIAVIDENADGHYDDLENGTLLIDLNQDGELIGRTDSAEYHALAEPFNIHGAVFEVASLSPDGTRLIIKPSAADVQMRAYLTPGEPAPHFTAEGLNDEVIDLVAESSGAKYVLLDFWASWCVPCRAEYPHLRQLYAQYKDYGLKIIGVSLDSEKEKAIELAEAESLSYPHAFDGGGWKSATAQVYRVHSIPQTYLLDGELNIVARGLRGDALEQRIQSLLGPGDPAAAEAAKAARPDPGPAAAPEQFVRDPQATLGKGMSLFLACGGVGGPGQVVQVNEEGHIAGSVDLSNTPYGLSFHSGTVLAAVPRSGNVVRIGADGNVDTFVEDATLSHPIALAALPDSHGVLIGDNVSDFVIQFSGGDDNHPLRQFDIPGGSPNHLESLSMAGTIDGDFVFSSSEVRAVLWASAADEPDFSRRLIDEFCPVAADPASPRWIALAADELVLFERDQESARLPYPAGRRPVRFGLATFGTDGTLVVGLQGSGGVEFHQVDFEEAVFRPLFVWQGPRVVDIALGNTLNWPAGSVANDGRQ